MARQDRGGRLGKNAAALSRGSQRLQGVKASRGAREEEIVTEESDKAAVNVAQTLELGVGTRLCGRASRTVHMGETGGYPGVRPFASGECGHVQDLEAERGGY